jgi:hypothetical protein
MRFKSRTALLALPIVISLGVPAFATPVAYRAPTHDIRPNQHGVAVRREPMLGAGFNAGSRMRPVSPPKASQDDWPNDMILDNFETRSGSVVQKIAPILRV